MRWLITLLVFPTILIAAESTETSDQLVEQAEPSLDTSSEQSVASGSDVITQVRDTSLGLTIKGNKELPNVLYIVPWKKGVKNDVSPIQGRIVEEVYGPTEMSVFKRRVRLYRAFNQNSQPVTDEPGAK